MVHGLPLGILMAAAWVEQLSLPEISQEISRSLDFLETDLQDVPQRQHSMRAVFDYSWHLLREPEQRVVASLSVFQGSFSRQAAQDICSASLPMLAALANKSLLSAAEGGRYEVHQLVGQYAGEKLSQAPPEEASMRDRHAAYYLAIVREQMNDLASSHLQTALTQIQQNLENVRAAWAWVVEHGQISLVSSTLEGLCRFYELKGLVP